jgi:hypothetical protein
VATRNTHAEAPADQSKRKRLDEMLDEALEETFPASDPIAISIETHRGDDADRPVRAATLTA